VIRAIDSQDTRFLRDMLRHAYHWRIAVVPSHRGHGGGGELLEALLERARSEGFSRISLSAEPGQTGFYEKHGFTEHSRDERTVTMVAEL